MDLKVLVSVCVISVFSSALPAYAKGGGHCGSEVVFNCDKHRVFIDGESSPINCGRSTPTSFHGKIGSLGRARGGVYRSMRGAPIVNLGLDKFDVVVHMLPPKHGVCPAGYNTSKKHTGCINVAPNILRKLAMCKGTPYQLVYHSKGSTGRLARNYHYHYRHHYASASEEQMADADSAE